MEIITSLLLEISVKIIRTLAQLKISEKPQCLKLSESMPAKYSLSS